MKKLIFCLILFCFKTSFSFAQNEQAILNSFKKKVKHADSSFLISPIILASQEFSKSKSGRIYYLLKFEKVKETSYDIEKTSSLVSPYTGYIILTFRVLSIFNQVMSNQRERMVHYSEHMVLKVPMRQMKSKPLVHVQAQ